MVIKAQLQKGGHKYGSELPRSQSKEGNRVATSINVIKFISMVVRSKKKMSLPLVRIIICPDLLGTVSLYAVVWG